MPKSASRFVCQACGAVAPRWVGRCEACGEWNTIAEEAAQPRPAAPKPPPMRAKSLASSASSRMSESFYPAELSGGMQERVALARAIAAMPEMPFFDEPTTGLDPIMGAVIDGLIVDCVKRLGATAIAITHDMASARCIGDQAAMLHGGKIVRRGPAASLLSSGNPLVAQFTHGRRESPIQMQLRK